MPTRPAALLLFSSNQAQGLKPLIPIGLALVLPFAAACGGAPGATRTAPPPVSGVTITALADPIEGVVQVTYDVVDSAAPLPPTLRVAFPNAWAGRTDLGQDIRAIVATLASGERVTVRRDDDGVAEIPTGEGHRVRFAYELAPSRRILTGGTRFRALISSDRFYAPGLAMLAIPLNAPPDLLRNVTFDGSCEQPAWCVHTTIPGEGAASMDTLSDAAFFAGRFDRVERSRDGITVELWIQRGVGAGPQLLADTLINVVDAQRNLNVPEDVAHTAAVVLLREDDPKAFNGAGRAGGFVLELGADPPTSASSLAELLAHENLHRLNGHRLLYAAADEFATMWFREGVTEYVALRNAAERGVVPTVSFFRAIGRALSGYQGNPQKQVAPATVGASFWSDRDLRRLPYDKGALLGLMIDLELRSAGLGSLEAFMEALRGEVVSGRVLVTNSSLRESLERYSGMDWGDFWARFVSGGEPLPVFERLEATGLRIVERIEPAPYFGLRASMTVSGQWHVTGVDPDSPSARAGLSAGTPLASEPYIPENPIESVAVLEVLSAGGPRRVYVQSTHGQRRTFALLADSDDYLDAFGLTRQSTHAR